MSDTEGRPAGGAPDPPDAVLHDTEEDVAVARGMEVAQMRRAVWLLPLISFLLLAGVWGIQKVVSGIPDAPAGARDVSMPVKRIYQVAHGAGMPVHAEPDRRAMAAWLARRLGSHAAVPDLAPAGLAPAGVRELSLGDGWGMVDYRDAASPEGDVIAVLAPLDAVQVPAEADARDLAGQRVWLRTDGDVHLAWVPGRGADWVLASRRDEAGLTAVAEALLGSAP
jgi:hypothetical protein